MKSSRQENEQRAIRLNFRAQHPWFAPATIDHNRPRQICRAMVVIHRLTKALEPDDPMVFLRPQRLIGEYLS